MSKIGALMLAIVGGFAEYPALAETPTAPALVVDARTLTAAGTISNRFLSYNIEMVELTGGRFWRPYGSAASDRYEYRPPLDLANLRLRKLAAGLAPAYVRYSGTWANATWFTAADIAPAKPPAGFDTVLTARQWRGAVAFAKAANARIVTSFATSAGTHDAKGIWQPGNAALWLAYTRKVGGTIAATEFGNEPNSLALLKPPTDYIYADYRRDYAIFAGWLRKASPGTLLVAPGTAELGEPIRTLGKRAPGGGMGEATDLLTAAEPRPDVVSFHFYGSASERCGGAMLARKPADARSPDWLAAIDAGIARTAALRDRLAPGAPIWNTESAETVCGGNRIASTFSDTFRFVDQLARSARQGVAVFAHNTLAASDYGLLDEGTYNPRPNYWAALVWKRLVGTQVLDTGRRNDGVNLYAHCLKGSRGGVVLIAINLETDAERSLQTGMSAQVYTLAQGTSGAKTVSLNGKLIELGKGDRLPILTGRAAPEGLILLPARTVSFITVPGAANPACRA
ncbi:MAG: hypothetical protein ABIU18_04935 [Novosphingobium sp.]